MNSLDTNILIYAVNSGCVEHAAALTVYRRMLDNPMEWIISDQVLFEFYRGLRNERILEKPLDHKSAFEQILFLREESGVLNCAYESSFWNYLVEDFKKSDHKPSHIFDHVLAITLKQNGVQSFYTRNTRHFKVFQFQHLINPIPD